MAGKKFIMTLFTIITLILITLLLFRGFNGGEDNWIKDSSGIWIKHGNPSEIPDYVLAQQNAIACAGEMYQKEKDAGVEFNSQCLGVCLDYAVDIVNVPRSEEDNLEENQCSDFREGKVSHFIELDKNGGVVRISG